MNQRTHSPQPTKQQLKTITVTVDRVIWTNDRDCTIATCHEDENYAPIKVVLNEAARGTQRWLVAGVDSIDKRGDAQVKARFATLAAPRNARELLTFLTSGHLAGWNYAVATRVIAHLRDVCPNDDPAAVLAGALTPIVSLDCVTPEMIDSLRDAYERAGGLMQIFAQLDEWGIGDKLAKRLINHYRFATVQVIRRDPYAPIADVSYYTWRTADSIALNHLNIERDDPRRIGAGLAEGMKRVTAWGHTWTDYATAVSQGCATLGLPHPVVEAAIAASAANDWIVRDDADRVFTKTLYDAEQAIAADVFRRVDRGTAVDPTRLTSLAPTDGVSDQQWAAVLMALSNRISLLTGGPGTGKSTSLRALVVAAHQIGLTAITLLAPTGKAAMRMREATGHEASTIHRKLKLAPNSAMPGIDAPISGLIVVDEVSMLDTQVAAALFAGVASDAHLLLVGDPDQLPSVGPGAVLRDLIAADVIARVHLDKVYRNDAGIAINAANIRTGARIADLPDCRILPSATPAHAQQQIVSLLTQELPPRGYLPSDVLVLCATNDGDAGRHTLNNRLQAVFNGRRAGQGIARKLGEDRTYELRDGDRVIVTGNDYDLGVFNGEVGTITEIQPSAFRAVVTFDDKVVAFQGSDLHLLNLAYALTVHRAQGSEAPVVVMPVFMSQVIDRGWIYTGITRARRQVYLLGDEGTMQRAAATPARVYDRATALVEALRARVADARPDIPPLADFAYSDGSDVYHTRRITADWLTACGVDTRGDKWQHRLMPSTACPCLRCMAATAAIVRGFPAQAPVATMVAAS